VFMEISEACRYADTFLAEKREATSPLLKVQLFERSHELSDKMAEWQARLGSARDQLIQRLKQLDLEWEQSDTLRRAKTLARLEELRRLFAFYDRWIAQVQERFVQLAL